MTYYITYHYAVMKWCIHISKQYWQIYHYQYLNIISISTTMSNNRRFGVLWCLFWSLKQMSGASINVKNHHTAVLCTNKCQELRQLTFWITQKLPVSGSSWACDKSIVTSALTSKDVKNSSSVPSSNIISREVLSGRQPTYN